ncbi:MAG: alpha/beta hydrolase family protein [Pseudomonadota bacterium]
MSSPAQRVSRIANQTYQHAAKVITYQPWWQSLPEDFADWQDKFELDTVPRLMVTGTSAIDTVLRTGLATLAGLLAIPTTLRPSVVALDRDNRQFYQRLAAEGDAARCYSKPERGVTMTQHKPGLLDYRPKVGRVDVLSFESAFKTLNPALQAHYSKFTRNRTAWAEHWQHGDRPRPTLIVIHGFTADPYWLNSRFLALPWFYEQGYDILLVTLPFHGRRQEHTSPFSGHGWFSHGFCHMNETMGHAIHDIRVFMDYLEDLGVPQMGVTGISLGGYTTALLASVDERLSCAIPNVPVVSIMDIVLEWFPAGWIARIGMKLGDISVTEARASVAIQSALSFKPVMSKDRLMLIAGAGDRFAPPKHTHILWEHWQRCRLHWFPGNHLIHLDQGRYLHAMRSFMKHIKFVP